jgi:superfamily II DNA/RNA helicase
VLGIAQTGTGKTAAFTLPMLSPSRRAAPGRACREPSSSNRRANSPPRSRRAFGKYGINHKLNLALLIGGVSFGEQEAKITRGADVLIATPGRLLDFADRGKILLNGIEILVIDEADRMLDMGFIPDIERICKLVPFTRQTLFFSATMPPEITRLTEAFLHNPVRVEVSRAASTAEGIAQTLVARALRPRRSGRRCAASSAAPEFQERADLLQPQARRAGGLSLSGEARLFRRRVARRPRPAFAHGRARRVPQRFRCSCSSVRTWRRVASTFPTSATSSITTPRTTAEDYVHRIGRTGRAGKLGVAVTIVTRADARSIDEIEKLIGQKIEWIGGETIAELREEDEAEGPSHRERGSSRRATPHRGEAEHIEAIPAEARSSEAEAGEPRRSRRRDSPRPREENRAQAERAPRAAAEPAPLSPEPERRPRRQETRQEPRQDSRREGAQASRQENRHDSRRDDENACRRNGRPCTHVSVAAG